MNKSQIESTGCLLSQPSGLIGFQAKPESSFMLMKECEERTTSVASEASGASSLLTK